MAPVLHYLKCITANREKPRRKSLAGLGVHVSRILIDASLNQIDMLQPERCPRAVSRTGPIGFDEFHHGFTSERSIADFASRYGLQFAVLQLILGVCLWASALRRFGRPRPPPQDVRVGSTDALFATSRLYREGRHFGHAATSILKELCSEYAVVAAVPARTGPTELAAALALKGRPELAAALDDVRRTSDAVVGEADVQQVAFKAAVARRLLRAKKPLPPAPRHAQARTP